MHGTAVIDRAEGSIAHAKMLCVNLAFRDIFKEDVRGLFLLPVRSRGFVKAYLRFFLQLGCLFFPVQKFDITHRFFSFFPRGLNFAERTPRFSSFYTMGKTISARLFAQIKKHPFRVFSFLYQ